MRRLSDIKFSEHIPHGIKLKLFRTLFEFDDGSVEMFPIVETSEAIDIAKHLRKLADRIEYKGE